MRVWGVCNVYIRTFMMRAYTCIVL